MNEKRARGFLYQKRSYDWRVKAVLKENGGKQLDNPIKDVALITRIEE
ncbi:hypothetical protein [Streptococcus respiraculi]|nr:hypothetical protein [Streptococcus respiraculi]